MSGLGIEAQPEMTGMGMQISTKVCCTFILKTQAADLKTALVQLGVNALLQVYSHHAHLMGPMPWL
jgi:hypothetical protein